VTVRRLIERQRRALASHDAGFTLVELIVAMMIIATVLLLLMIVQTSALVTTSQARQRLQATAVANQTLEELRALPWSVLGNGLNSTYASSGVDPNISAGTMLHPPANPSINEVLISSSGQTNAPPLASPLDHTNKIIQTDPSVPGMTFEARSYTSISPSTPTGVITLTVIVTWKRVGDAKTSTVIARSAAYAPGGGCGDPTNQPYLGACQALMSSSGGIQGPMISVTGTTPVGAPAASDVPILPGTTPLSADLFSAQGGGAVASQQATTVDSAVTTPGGIVNDATDTPFASTGRTRIVNQASNDTGSSGAAPPNPADVTGTGASGSLSVTSGPYGLQLNSSALSNGTAKASLVASCHTGIPAGQGCGTGFYTGSNLASGIFSIGTNKFTLASIPATSGTNEGWAGRFTTSFGTSAVGCTSLSGAGCASAGATRTLPAQVNIGAGPWSAGAAASGIVQVLNYWDSVRVERGASQKTTAAWSTRTGTLKYWNGSSYVSLPVPPPMTSVTLGPKDPVTGLGDIGVVSWTDGVYTVTAATTVTITQAASAVTGDDAACITDSCSIDADTGGVSVSVMYTVSDGTTTFAFVSVISLGTTHANAAFKAAPDA